MRLKYQLFLTLLTASAVLITLMYVIGSWSFSRGFLEYVNQSEAERIAPLGESLIETYEKEGDWSWVTPETIKEYSDIAFGPRATRGQPPSPPQSQSIKEPRQGGKSDSDKAGDRSGTKAPLDRTTGPPSNAPPPPPLALTDENRNVLSGSKRGSRLQWMELVVGEDVVGYLTYPSTSVINRQFDRVFAAKQKKTFGWTALMMILLSALLSIPLASRLVKPLLTVNNAVREISGGNFGHKVDVNRRDEIGDLANNINFLSESLEKNRDARQRWIAEISHELRTPLAVLRGEVEAVQDGIRVLDNAAIESLHSELLSLGRLIDDLHTLSVSDVGALDYQLVELNVNELLAKFLDSQQESLRAKNLTLEQNFDPEAMLVQGDAQRLEQLFSNLMQNSCRYTDAGGVVRIELSKAHSDGDEVLILDWIDSSPSVDADALPKLFDPLFRTETSRNREFGGTGLGLSIAQRIVQAHDGHIGVAISEIGGLHIKVTLPTITRVL